jgi:hypothetical protein
MVRRSMAAAAVLHGRFNAGATDEVLLDGRWRTVQHVAVVELDDAALSAEDREAEGMLAGGRGGPYDRMRIRVTVGRGAQAEDRDLWPGDVLVLRRDPRLP